MNNLFSLGVQDGDPVCNLLYTLYKLGFTNWGIRDMDELDAMEVVMRLEEILDDVKNS